MKPESKNHLSDMLKSLQTVQQFVKDQALEDYRSNLMLRAAVERKFIILGEALRRLERSEPAIAQHVAHRAEIIAFRNILVHDYERVTDEEVWGIIHKDVSPLVIQIERLLKQPESDT